MRASRQITLFSTIVLTLFIGLAGCKKSSGGGGGTPTPTPPVPPDPPVVTPTITADAYVTTTDQTSLLLPQTTTGTYSSSNATITVDSTQTFQSVDGFGYTLTSGSATLINALPAATRTALLRELFSNDANGIAVSYLRIAIGASDLSASVYSYDDMPTGQTDPSLTNFSLAPDMAALIPLLKDILVINPAIKILATPWSAPAWMKDNGSMANGSLQTQYYTAYANYFVKYIRQMQIQGITIDAVTPQNEPLNGGNNPSMNMSAQQQTDFIKNNLGPAFQLAGITTKIIAYDHNCDRADYPLTVLADATARSFVNGSAFHLYAGDISALTQVHNAYPDKQVYFTEQYTASGGEFGGDLKWHLKNVIIGSMRNWSRVALEWNLANDPGFGPHTPGGCTTCKGALTIDNSLVLRNVAYFIVAHASKLVPPGSIRIASNSSNSSLQNVAFRTPAGKKVVLVENDGGTTVSFNIGFHGKWIATTLPAGAVGTYAWN